MEWWEEDNDRLTNSWASNKVHSKEIDSIERPPILLRSLAFRLLCTRIATSWRQIPVSIESAWKKLSRGKICFIIAEIFRKTQKTAVKLICEAVKQNIIGSFSFIFICKKCYLQLCSRETANSSMSLRSGRGGGSLWFWSGGRGGWGRSSSDRWPLLRVSVDERRRSGDRIMLKLKKR